MASFTSSAPRAQTAQPSQSGHGRYAVAQKECVDELVFNRSMKFSNNSFPQTPAPRWTFEPSYSGIAAARLYQRRNGPPADMMEPILSDRAINPKIVERSALSSHYRIAHKPYLHAFISEKVTNKPFTAPALPMVTRCTTPPDASSPSAQFQSPFLLALRCSPESLLCLIHDPQPTPQILPRSHRYLPKQPAPRRLQPLMVWPPGSVMPYGLQEPGRNRYFMGDVRTKLP